MVREAEVSRFFEKKRKSFGEIGITGATRTGTFSQIASGGAVNQGKPGDSRAFPSSLAGRQMSAGKHGRKRRMSTPVSPLLHAYTRGTLGSRGGKSSPVILKGRLYAKTQDLFLLKRRSGKKSVYTTGPINGQDRKEGLSRKKGERDRFRRQRNREGKRKLCEREMIGKEASGQLRKFDLTEAKKIPRKLESISCNRTSRI